AVGRVARLHDGPVAHARRYVLANDVPGDRGRARHGFGDTNAGHRDIAGPLRDAGRQCGSVAVALRHPVSIRDTDTAGITRDRRGTHHDIGHTNAGSESDARARHRSLAAGSDPDTGGTRGCHTDINSGGCIADAEDGTDVRLNRAVAVAVARSSSNGHTDTEAISGGFTAHFAHPGLGRRCPVGGLGRVDPVAAVAAASEQVAAPGPERLAAARAERSTGDSGWGAFARAFRHHVTGRRSAGGGVHWGDRRRSAAHRQLRAGRRGDH
ncbi:MAG: hypothetical protein ACRDJ9_09090, partial [Dehalococcoidia bacterium]